MNSEWIGKELVKGSELQVRTVWDSKGNDPFSPLLCILQMGLPPQPCLLYLVT
jgi:hypothetical protein